MLVSCRTSHLLSLPKVMVSFVCLVFAADICTSSLVSHVFAVTLYVMCNMCLLLLGRIRNTFSMPNLGVIQGGKRAYGILKYDCL